MPELNAPSTNPYMPPGVDDAPPSPALPPRITRGARLAGAFLLVHAALVIAHRLLWSGGLGTFGAVIIDVAIGVSLVRGNADFRPWAMVRALLGGIISGGLFLARKQYFDAAFVIALAGSIFNLVVGDPDKLRITLSAIVFGVCALVELIGLFRLLG